MTKDEAVNWIINLSADIGKIQHQELWHYEQALSEIREILEAQTKIVRCKECKYWQPHTQDDYCGLLTPDDDCYAISMNADDFCSYGVRQTEGSE